MSNYEDLILYFEDQLDKIQYNNRPIELYDPIKYTLGFGGKRIRPVTTLMGCELFSSNYKKALPQAIAIELFHNFTLIHDDIMDDAPIRRGKETVFKKWNSNIAILSGDTLFALAYQYAQQADNVILKDILSVFNQTAIEVCEGQQFDLNYETKDSVSVDEYINMIRLKTGVLFGASLKIGALIGGASTSDADLLYDFGVNIGLGFQLKDDLLDTFGNEIVFGKKNGGDIVSNKKTYLYIKALESAIDSDRNILLKHYKSSELQSDSKIKLIKDMFIKLKVDIAASEVIDGFFNLGIESLDKINLPSKRKIQLMEVAVKMIDRNK
ncbi:MAG: polyprenyl synthetase family protein [Lentimicrobiaceae bacterium]|jgi:geranylgeranyl diphosphate synthase type II|nr:polyprenyl synthetase family protein [Lentimicrobiaceae bacterium]MBT3454847.1 polyprenyl synthetase family protein [Lentimicrobiaceae bacterium]MBT3818527.1 polyprenyl synthetase family protein [Lentimicrobiaceae bacterium]MBT4060894.1 polyprenyl synthetase family protein [Lentimicrobiaceae bacterium]MBT4190567.1 polyprenyl synthetase family protein [Lentimicrobiaceae bacterium]